MFAHRHPARRAAVLRDKITNAIQRLAIGVNEWRRQQLGNAQQLASMFVADANGDRNGHDAPENGGPEGIDECFILSKEQDQLVTGSGAELLQMTEDAKRARMQLGKTDAPFSLLALDVGDGSIQPAHGFEHFR